MFHEIMHSADDLISSDGAWWILGINAILLIPAIFAMFFYPVEGLIAIGGSSNGETGATAALPIWTEFMRAYIDARGDRKNPPDFEAPGNIVFVTLDSGSTEAFINGTQPQGLAPIPAVSE